MNEKTRGEQIQEQMEELHRAWLDLMFAMLQSIIRFTKHVNLELKPWVKEREDRERRKDEK